jgi:hypothetical protein
MIWLGIFLAWFLFGLWRRPDRFALGAMIIGMGFVVTLNVLNPEAFIVRQNIARYWAGGDLDVRYLESLSADAVPALVAAVVDGQGERGESRCWWKKVYHDHRGGCSSLGAKPPKSYEHITLSEVLEESLKDHFEEMQNDSQWLRWQSAKFSNWRAYQQLSRIFATPGEGFRHSGRGIVAAIDLRVVPDLVERKN